MLSSGSSFPRGGTRIPILGIANGKDVVLKSDVHYLYIIYSKEIDHYYIGVTYLIEKRLERHLAGLSRFTKRAKDWKLVYNEEFNTRSEALRRERQIKRKKSRKYIESLLTG